MQKVIFFFMQMWKLTGEQISLPFPPPSFLPFYSSFPGGSAVGSAISSQFAERWGGGGDGGGKGLPCGVRVCGH